MGRSGVEMRSTRSLDRLGEGTAVAALASGGQQRPVFDLTGLESAERRIPVVGAESETAEPRLGGVPWASHPAGGNLCRWRALPRNVLSSCRLADIGSDSRLR